MEGRVGDLDFPGALPGMLQMRRLCALLGPEWCGEEGGREISLVPPAGWGGLGEPKRAHRRVVRVVGGWLCLDPCVGACVLCGHGAGNGSVA